MDRLVGLVVAMAVVFALLTLGGAQMTPRERGAQDYTHEIVVLDEESLWKKHPTIGLAELAARLGGLSTLERRGSVVWQDNFSNGLGSWVPTVIPGVGSVVLVSSPIRLGIYAAQINTGPGGPQDASMRHFEPASYGKGNIGIEVHATLDHWLPDFKIIIELWTGTHYKRFHLFYDAFNKTLNYMDTAGLYQSFATSINLSVYPDLFIPFKLVVDPINDTYLRAFVAGEEYDLSMYPSRSVADLVTVAHSENWIMLRSRHAADSSVEVDAVILTVKEPAV